MSSFALRAYQRLATLHFRKRFPQVMLEHVAVRNVLLAKRSWDYRMGGGRLKTILDAEGIACPACTAQAMFCRSGTPQVAACGFESYNFECDECGALLAGIIDPYDNELLLSELGG
jgi:hypothetical protein